MSSSRHHRRRSTATRTSAYELRQHRDRLPEDVARLIDEESRDLPGVDVRRRGARANTSTARCCRTSWATPARSRPTSATSLQAAGYLNDDEIGKTGVEDTFESDLRGTYGQETGRAGRSGPRHAHGLDRPSSRLRATHWS